MAPVTRKDNTLSEDDIRKLKANTDFIWQNTAEPHAERKNRIMKKYGKEINQLMGYEWKTKYVALSAVSLQLTCAILVVAGHHIQLPATVQDFIAGNPFLSANLAPLLATVANALSPITNPVAGSGFVSDALLLLRGASWASWTAYLALSYIVGGTIQHNLFLAIHEITHNLAFRRPFHNDILSMICNLPIGVPYSMMFKTYHAEHHRYQGWDGIDTDIPSDIETKLFRTTIGKAFFAFFQILFYAFRPCLLRQQTLHRMHALNWAIVVGFWVGFVGYFLGWNTLGSAWFFCALSTFFAGAFHPMSGHFISEHYVFDPEGIQETYSYYGPLNVLGYNVGLHNEHHDFPNVPWTRLHEVAKIAPEYYDHLIVTDSWPKTVWRFITDDRVTTFSRVKREKDAWKRSNLMPTETTLAPAVFARGEDKSKNKTPVVAAAAAVDESTQKAASPAASPLKKGPAAKKAVEEEAPAASPSTTRRATSTTRAKKK